MSHPRFHFVQAHGKVLLFTLLISLSFPIGSALTAVLDPLVVTWARYLLAALTFVILLACQRRLALPSLRDLGRYTLISLPALCYFVAMFVALQETSALDASALYTTVPLISALASMLVLQRRIGWSMAFALLGGMVAAALIIFRGELSQLASLSLTPSNRIYLLGCVGMALNPILVKRYYRGESFAHLTCWTLICATLLLTLVAAPRLLTTDWQQVSPPLWLGLAYLALFATALSFFLFQQGSVVLQPEQVSAYTYLIPVLVLLIGMLSGEEVIWRQVGWGVLGVLLTMAVMVLVPARQARRV
ncbi:DMT family transporter [Aeromonas hydrophila]|uniref:DMT family transporter n=1 Tax=Aeromonas hydrophila TaxID=644 RepID=UPI0013038D8F|nr:EamA family transporter [Aeromonas hydrophila]QGZ74244.1 EamA family transporter [Aeromonas hydrophila]